MDGMEEFWKRHHFGCLRIPTIRKAEEFPYKGLSEVVTEWTTLTGALDYICNKLVPITRQAGL
jgi:hypothetical protein